MAAVADVMAAVPGFVEEAGTALEAWRDGNMKTLTLEEKTRVRVNPTLKILRGMWRGEGGHYGPERQQRTAVR